MRTAARMTVVALAALAASQAAPAWAGGVGDFLSPAFGTSCANLNGGALASGSTTHGAGPVGGNLLGLPLGSPLNQCGGADLRPPLTLWPDRLHLLVYPAGT
ncbi:hypothetical protein [Streptomyces flavidovirens]